MNKITILTALALIISFNTISAQFKLGIGTGAQKVATTMAIVEKLYVDDVDENKLAEDVIIAMLEKLDPHSSYITATEVQEMNEPLEGNFDGIGVSFNMMSDTLYIIETISGGPSEKVGILPGDRIIEVDDTLIAGVKKTTKDIMQRLRGPKGTVVNVKILRRGVSKLIDFKITRAKIPIYSIDASYMIDQQVGYIRLSRFAATTLQEFQDALKKLRAQGMKDLILDLEYNGGGYLSAATGMANEFLGPNKLIVYTEGKNQSRYSEKSDTKGSFEKGKLVILVNEGSASASEIVSGAIQDWDRGVIVGRRTFGKGLVQRPVPLADGAMLRLTVARYYTPTGRCIQKPYVGGDKDSYNKDLIERYNHGEMMSADSIHFPDSLRYKTLINQRTVFGGGGIMPDNFVPLDTTLSTEYHRNLIAKGLINKVALGEIDLHRKDLLAKYPTIDSYKKEYQVAEDMLTKLIEEGKSEKVEFKEDQYLKAKPYITSQIKALMARDLYDTAAYFQIMNEENDIFKKGLEIIKDDKHYHQLLNSK